MLNYEITQEQWANIHKRDGRMEMAEINKLYIKEKKSPEEISKKMGISVKEVKQALIELGYDLD
jgi:transcription initiation factor IIE alpha subunit